jgi:hypothetical protein
MSRRRAREKGAAPPSVAEKLADLDREIAITKWTSLRSTYNENYPRVLQAESRLNDLESRRAELEATASKAH